MNLLFRFLVWWLKNPAQRTICFLVIACHLAALIWLSMDPPESNKRTKKLVVRTFSPTKEPLKTIVTSAAPAKKPSQSSNKPLPSPPTKKKKETQEKQVPVPKKPEPLLKKRKTFEVSNKKSASQEHLKELEERIAKIAAKNDRMSSKSELMVPSTIALSSPSFTPLVSEVSVQESNATDEEYVSFLIGYLQECLQLPDVGEVKIQINLRKDGSVEKMKVVHAESAKNKQYLEEHLPKLSFPRAPSETNYSFLITFCNKF